MALQLRRVVTGHDANGKAVVKIDKVCKIYRRPANSVFIVFNSSEYFSGKQHRRN